MSLVISEFQWCCCLLSALRPLLWADLSGCVSKVSPNARALLEVSAAFCSAKSFWHRTDLLLCIDNNRLHSFASLEVSSDIRHCSTCCSTDDERGREVVQQNDTLSIDKRERDNREKNFRKNKPFSLYTTTTAAITTIDDLTKCCSPHNSQFIT